MPNREAAAEINSIAFFASIGDMVSRSLATDLFYGIACLSGIAFESGTSRVSCLFCVPEGVWGDGCMSLQVFGEEPDNWGWQCVFDVITSSK